MPPDICPGCGAEIPPGAKACPECGSDEETGWSAKARYDDLDLPEENFAYEDYVKREFGGERIVPRGVHWFWWIVAILVVVGLVSLWLL